MEGWLADWLDGMGIYCIYPLYLIVKYKIYFCFVFFWEMSDIKLRCEKSRAQLQTLKSRSESHIVVIANVFIVILRWYRSRLKQVLLFWVFTQWTIIFGRVGELGPWRAVSSSWVDSQVCTFTGGNVILILQPFIIQSIPFKCSYWGMMSMFWGLFCGCTSGRRWQPQDTMKRWQLRPSHSEG